MAARLWQGILAGEIALAVAGAWLVATLSALPAPAVVASGLAILAALQWLLVPAAWLLARVPTRSAHTPQGALTERSHSAGTALRAFATEGAALARATLAMSLAPLRRPPRLDSAAGDHGSRPVLLIHGVLCNGSVWRPLACRLEKAGFGPVRTLDLEPVRADIEWHAVLVARELAAMQRACGGERVAIVAHSMGGLVARAALRRIEKRTGRGTGSQIGIGPAHETVSRIVTLGTPHHGTAIAAVLRSRPMQQMSPGSPWLQSLNARRRDPGTCPDAPDAPDALESSLPATGAPDGPPIASIYSCDDALVVPPSSARLEGARNIELRGVGHLGLLTSRLASAAVLRELAADSRESRDGTPRCAGREGAGSGR